MTKTVKSAAQLMTDNIMSHLEAAIMVQLTR